jgi:glycosyltransferase involved in cell wall biosynthesis
MSRPKISVIIPAYNEERLLPGCLDSIMNLDYDKELIEIIVVDNGSTDRTREIAESYGAKVIRDDSKNVSGLRNLGVRESSGDIIAFVDADCVVSKDWLQKAAVYFDDLNIAAWGSPPTIPKDATWVQKTWYIVRQKDAKIHDVDWLESMNLFVRKEKFNSIGGFNESLVTCEDVDFSYRLKAHGSIISNNRIEVIHFGEAATIRQFMRKEIWRGHGNLRGILNHGLKKRELPSISIPIYFGLIIPVFLAATILKNDFLTLGITFLLFILPSILGALKVRSRIFSSIQLVQLLFLLQIYFICRTIAVFNRFS